MAHQIAFLGTGIMGAPMAANLIKAGFRAAVWNRTRSKTDSLTALGARVADGPADCVHGADYILSILDSGPVVREVFFDSGAADAMKGGGVFIDMASIPPKMAQRRGGLVGDHGRRGVRLISSAPSATACGSPTRSWSPATSPAWRKACYLPIRNFVKDLDTVLATAEQIGLPQLPIVKEVRDVFKALYDQGHERWDHSAFLLYLEKLNAPARLGNKADTPPD